MWFKRLLQSHGSPVDIVALATLLYSQGRARKRLQYNRRFVNVVVGFGGKKKGPNANPNA